MSGRRNGAAPPLKGPTADFEARVIVVPIPHKLLVEPILHRVPFAQVKRWAAVILQAEAEGEAAELQRQHEKTGPRIVLPGGG